MSITVIGLSHKTAAVEVRERLSIPEPDLQEAIAQILNCSHVEEVAILSTCNRLEIYFVSSNSEQGIREVSEFLAERGGLSIDTLRQHLFILLRQDAIMHLMRVAAGLDSLVLGEGQILAQVKTTHKQGQKHKGVGRLLNRLFKQAITAGKRVRTETSIGTGAVSISSAAVELALLKVEDLSSCRIAIVGAGKMSRLLVQHLVSKGAQKIAILNRSMARAEELAARFKEADLSLYPLQNMMNTLATADLVFTSTSATEPIVDRARLEPVLQPGQPMMLFDISVPRNVASDVKEIDGVQAFDVDDLKEVVAQNHASRRRMALEAEALLEEEVDAFEIWWRSLETVTTINCLRQKVETIREQELEKALSRLGSEFGKKQQETIEALSRGIVNKILHDPMVQLRAQQDVDARRQAMSTLHLLFNLEPLDEDSGDRQLVR
ncbi:MAG: glutamyl-tRNA reductase [Cyanobacteria bacterium P01_D01_bin.73]